MPAKQLGGCVGESVAPKATRQQHCGVSLEVRIKARRRTFSQVPEPCPEAALLLVGIGAVVVLSVHSRVRRASPVPYFLTG